MTRPAIRNFVLGYAVPRIRADLSPARGAVRPSSADSAHNFQNVSHAAQHSGESL